ncbi:MAG: nuclear transport factor 2 family protein [Nocardioidaceae bacterium]
MISRFYEALEARDWSALEDLLDVDVVYEVPQTRERVLGRGAYVHFNREYPGDWHLEVRAVHEDASGGAAEVYFCVDGHELTNVALFRFTEAGLIGSVRDFWPESYEPPEGREHLVERY